MEFVIFLLMVSFPLLVAVIDRQYKKRKGVPQVKAHPLFPGDEAEEAGPEPKHRPVSMREEGERAIVRPKQPVAARQPESAPAKTEEKLEIDKKKLILYSEILKPKFDD